jgi:hypothetical protein
LVSDLEYSELDSSYSFLEIISPRGWLSLPPLLLTFPE